MYETGVQAESGSLLEIAYDILFRMRSNIKFWRTRALIESSRDDKGSSLKDFWDKYTDALFPYLEKNREAREADLRKVMAREAQVQYTVKPVKLFVPRAKEDADVSGQNRTTAGSEDRSRRVLYDIGSRDGEKDGPD